MKAKAPTTTAMAAATVTAFCPDVNSEANRFNPSRARVISLLGTRAISDLHVHDVGERGHALVDERHRDLRVEGRLRGLDHGVGHTALSGRRLRLRRRRR